MVGIQMPMMGVIADASQPEPDDLPSITLWYNSSATQTNGVNNFSSTPSDGTEITAWNDLSNVGQDANVNNSAGGNGPTYETNTQNGLSALWYQSADLCNLDINPLVGWAKAQTAFTIYVAHRVTSFSGAFPLVSTDTNGGFYYDGTYWQVGMAGGVSTAQSLSTDTANWHQFGVVFDGSKTDGDQTTQNNLRLKFRVDGVPQALTFTSNPGTALGSPSVMYVGGNNRNVPKQYMNGYIGEVLMWNRALSISEQLGVETYLRNKWGLA